jgi:hypothetical protein
MHYSALQTDLCERAINRYRKKYHNVVFTKTILPGIMHCELHCGTCDFESPLDKLSVIGTNRYNSCLSRSKIAARQ